MIYNRFANLVIREKRIPSKSTGETMPKYNAVIKLKEEPFKIIKWLTKNFDKEIGALGVGEFVNGELVVERLLFPKQIVNGAHVHFKPEDWGSVIEECRKIEEETGEDPFGKICFYWHKHPDGSATASQGDEQDTFAVFMPEETDREYFGFMQTANQRNGDGFTYDARIEMRKPIMCTIENAKLASGEDDSVADLCKQIIVDKVTSGNAYSGDQPGAHGKQVPTTFTPGHTYNVQMGNTNWRQSQKKLTATDAEVDDSDVAAFEVKRKNGLLRIEVSDFLHESIMEMLESELFKHQHKQIQVHKDVPSKGMFTIDVHPQKKRLEILYKHMTSIAKEMFGEGAVQEAINESIDKSLEEALQEGADSGTIEKNSVYNEKRELEYQNKPLPSAADIKAGKIPDTFDMYRGVYGRGMD